MSVAKTQISRLEAPFASKCVNNWNSDEYRDLAKGYPYQTGTH